MLGFSHICECVCVFVFCCLLSLISLTVITHQPEPQPARRLLLSEHITLSYLIVSEVAEIEDVCFFHFSPAPSLTTYLRYLCIHFAFIPLSYFCCYFLFPYPKFFLSQIAFLRLPVWGKVWARALPFTLDDTNSLVMADVPLISLSPVKGTLSECDLVWFKSIEAPHDVISCRKSTTNRQYIF